MVDLLATRNAPQEEGLLADKAAEHIRILIGAGKLGPGDRVNEMEIAQRLNISRGPVREAIRRLASSGLVVSTRNRGSRVVTLDKVGARNLYEVREALESLSARLAATRMTQDQKQNLLRMLDEHEKTMDEEETDSYPAGSSDWDFHLAVLAGGGNDLAWRICGSDLRDMLTLLRARHGRSRGRGRRALQEHRWIAEAIMSGDADLAGLLMAQHIRNSYQNLLSLFEMKDAE